jgi:hypothetical protein
MDGCPLTGMMIASSELGRCSGIQRHGAYTWCRHGPCGRVKQGRRLLAGYVVVHLTDLTLVTYLNEPFDVLVEEWPPGSFQELHTDCVNLLVTQNIMYFFQQLVPLLLRHYNLVFSMCVPSP